MTAFPFDESGAQSAVGFAVAQGKMDHAMMNKMQERMKEMNQMMEKSEKE